MIRGNASSLCPRKRPSVPGEKRELRSSALLNSYQRRASAVARDVHREHDARAVGCKSCLGSASTKQIAIACALPAVRVWLAYTRPDPSLSRLGRRFVRDDDDEGRDRSEEERGQEPRHPAPALRLSQAGVDERESAPPDHITATKHRHVHSNHPSLPNDHGHLRRPHTSPTLQRRAAHEGIGDRTPSWLWTPSTRVYPERLKPPVYPAHLEIRRVSSAGTGFRQLPQAITILATEREVAARLWRREEHLSLLSEKSLRSRRSPRSPDSWAVLRPHCRSPCDGSGRVSAA